ncbi:hypothetical protein M0805_005013 [Coniferiporia weirii]|nr:hypothetical protein M0805_005013 [Coniferiporia weirii]
MHAPEHEHAPERARAPSPDPGAGPSLSIDPDTASFDLLTSLRYDPRLLTAAYNTDVNGLELPYLLFAYHVDRLVCAAEAFAWPRALDAVAAPGAPEHLRHMCDQAVMQCTLPEKERGLGLRVLLSSSGDLRVEVHPTRALPHDLLLAAHFDPSRYTSDVDAEADADAVPRPLFAVTLDTEPTRVAVAALAAHKTTARAHYDAARARAGLRDRREAREVVLVNEQGELTEGSVRNVAFWREGGWVTPSERCGALPGTVRRLLLERGLVREGVLRSEDVRPGEWVLLFNGWDGTLLGRICAG